MIKRRLEHHSPGSFDRIQYLVAGHFLDIKEQCRVAKIIGPVTKNNRIKDNFISVEAGITKIVTDIAIKETFFSREVL